jgi:hypothetical protein
LNIGNALLFVCLNLGYVKFDPIDPGIGFLAHLLICNVGENLLSILAGSKE